MNPFKVLNIKKNSSNKEIIQAVGFAMQQKKYSGNEIALAQKMLLDPISKSCQEFLQFADLSDIKKDFNKNKPAELEKITIDDFMYQNIFV